MDEILASIRKIISEDPSGGSYAGADRRRGASNGLPRADVLPPSMPALPPAPSMPAAAAPQVTVPALPPTPKSAQPQGMGAPSAAAAQGSSLEDDLADLLDDAPAAKAQPATAPEFAVKESGAKLLLGANSFDGTPDWLLARVAPSEVTPPMPRMPDLGSVRPSQTMAPPLAASTAPRIELERAPAPQPVLAAPRPAPAQDTEPRSLEADLARVAAAVAEPVPNAPKVARESEIEKAAALFKPMPVPAAPVAQEPKAVEIKAASPVPAVPTPADVPKPVAVTPAVKVKVEAAPAAAKPVAPASTQPTEAAPTLASAAAAVPAPAVTATPAIAAAAAAKSAEPAKAPPATPAPAAGNAALALGVQTMEDTVAELLRPMLRQWLDTNMPRIVEKALRVEMAESLKKPPLLKN
jgi:cell pole-organizing protein PopZ